MWKLSSGLRRVLNASMTSFPFDYYFCQSVTLFTVISTHNPLAADNREARMTPLYPIHAIRDPL